MTDRIVILGAGSIGCYIGGKLIASGADVTLIGRPRYRDMIAKHGLTLTHFEQAQAYVPPSDIHFAVTPDAMHKADIIIVCVKSGDSAEAGAQIAKHAPKTALTVSLQNGVGNTEIISAAAPAHTVIAAMVPNNVLGMEDGRFHCGTDGHIIIADHPQSLALVQQLNTAGVPAQARSDMQAVQWGKLLLNLGNSINTLSGLPYLAQLSDRNYRRVMAAAMDETLAVLRRAGITPAKIGAVKPQKIPGLLRLPDWLYHPIMRRTIKIDAHARSSMWQDLEAGRGSEVDFLNGAVIELGRKTGVATPVNSLLTQLTHSMFEAGESPMMSGKTLWDMTQAQMAGHAS